MSTRIASNPLINGSLLETLRGALTLALLVLNTLLVFIPFVPIALLKLMAPSRGLRRRLTFALLAQVDWWTHGIRFISNHMTGSTLEVRGLDNVSLQGRYLVLCNHQCWWDIPVLTQAFQGHIQFPRFFIKYELLWLPVVGFACWAMDFPFMRRYSREVLQKRPELKGADIEATRRACAKYVHMPVTVVNFVEATRGTPAKRSATQSPYRHLLRPKSGGIALSLEALGDLLDGVLDITILYPGVEAPSFWDYCCGRIPHVVVHARRLAVPTELMKGNYADDANYRRDFQHWLNRTWREKDLEMDRLLAEYGSSDTLSSH